MNIKTSLQQSQKWLVTLLLLAGSITSYAQSECFEYDVTDETIITGLTETGLAASSLTIPKEVTAVRSGAFSSTSAKVSALVIEAGGNPAFASGLFGDRENPLGDIKIYGSSMKVDNIRALFVSLGTEGALDEVYIEGYNGTWTDIVETSVLTEGVDIIMPAAMVPTQQFGAAKVYGRFTLTKDLVTFCGNATFLDLSDGSNMLFYVADDCNKTEGYIHIKRVRYIANGQGVLIHKAKGTSFFADLPRVSDGDITDSEQTLYDSNMLKGVKVPTEIETTDGEYTNLVLKDGAFHPLKKKGTIGANKAYLQVLTSMLAREVLIISFDEETNGVKEVNRVKEVNDDSYFDLQGRRVAQPTKGLYIMNGKKYVIR